MELQVVELAKENGLTENKAKELQQLYAPMLSTLTEKEDMFNQIIERSEQGIDDEVSLDARTLRLELQKIRTTADKARKSAKEESLRIGKAIQSAYNTLEYAVKSKEEKLLNIEKYQERLAEEKRERLRLEREKQLSKFEVTELPGGLESMSDTVFENILLGYKTAYEKKQEEIRKEQEEREEAQRIQKLSEQRKEQLLEYWDFVPVAFKSLNMGMATDMEFRAVLEEAKESKKNHLEEQEKIRLENERIKKEQEEKERIRINRQEQLKPYLSFIDDYESIITMDDENYNSSLNAIKEAAKAKKEEEKRQQEAEEKRRREEEEKIRLERLEKERIEKELADRKREEEERKRQEEINRQNELQKGDKEKIKDFVNDLRALKDKYSFDSKVNISLFEKAVLMIDNIIKLFS